ncbi:DNA cytosine methyltransferase [Streptomyces sp. NBC_01381]|uniref:DNA cytosine methyltransferase n=1 Tax=Streptomyces sp. NBC_01381 TaxID=2903845 RepID=UPI00224CAA48|nr:DNA cytosine methyltransferase [Streptomyces sp. NBC_01381]MCX4666987.1 DNA cytosine methyltransferase [Streptomyces sp. NBC_01381]
MTVALPRQLPPVGFRIVDLFAGPGGLDMAATVLGVPSLGIEWDANAVTTREAAGLRTVHGDVRSYGPKDFPEANVLAGGPPCQSFTVAGTGAGRRALDDVLKFVQRLVDRDARANIDADLAEMDDERTGLVLEPLRWALSAIDNDELRPYEAIVLEQVPAALPVWEAYGAALTDEGYSVAHGILHTEEFGVPQTRRRAILVARRNGHTAALPTPTHQRYRKGAPRPPGDLVLQSWVAMEDVLTERIGRFQVVSNYGTGGNPRLRGRRRSCEPSATVTGKVSRNRIVTDDTTELDLPRLSTGEAGQLQTFPKRFPWSGGDISQQIGNAVPPRLGIHVLSAALGLATPGEDAWRALAEWSPQVRDEARADAPH